MLTPSITRYGVSLKPVSPADLPALRRWRNSDEVRLNMLSQTLISPSQQRQWYERISNDESQCHWCAYVNNVRTGYANLKGFAQAPLSAQHTADSGLYLGQSSVRHGLLAAAVALCQLDVAFEQFKIGQIQTQVKRDNNSAIKLNQMLGYQPQTNENYWVTLTLTAPSYIRARQNLMRFFRHV
ncbi:GNAT family N-acetyltransferase [Celerinatantimonas diazotrophica]|uniref:RimJ/RimL family protein N-acetyltransferase n=1 Tax=Celerinatantimonas diazotrophica TaxID=412034 RepID=A0A4R1K9Q5_9GAMM|nr:GNAT family N-acetyltransferase [Celerinatantimonas diazotrophica]TCK61095.1 RimJ/RimL family protein N-acetyltransferase [Celerinatantimonas diazotrophica]CAG9295144.1 hypothetical protein CEDIAZO_00256 [Celerinatantimonas diazotrophica]